MLFTIGYESLLFHKTPVLQQPGKPGVSRHAEFRKILCEPLVIVQAVVIVPDRDLKLTSQFFIDIGRQISGVIIHEHFIQDHIVHKSIHIDIGRVPSLRVREIIAVQHFFSDSLNGSFGFNGKDGTFDSTVYKRQDIFIRVKTLEPAEQPARAVS